MEEQALDHYAGPPYPRPVTSTCVLHLARHANGWDHLDRFLHSYDQHPAGMDHDLVVILKGFPDPDSSSLYRERLAPYDVTIIEHDEAGLDLGSYWRVARTLPYETFCFLNTYSLILDSGWLAKLIGHLGPTVGIVGATGSWESHVSAWTKDWLPGALRSPWQAPSAPFEGRRPTLAERKWVLKHGLTTLRDYPVFPNPHIRTNSFAMRRDLMAEMHSGTFSDKSDTMRFESGRCSLTRLVRKRGLDTLVVGRDGHAYPPDKWPESNTYRSGGQQNLLVSDNRTRQWSADPPALKQKWALMAWGPRSASGHVGSRSHWTVAKRS